MRRLCRDATIDVVNFQVLARRPRPAFHVFHKRFGFEVGALRAELDLAWHMELSPNHIDTCDRETVNQACAQEDLAKALTEEAPPTPSTCRETGIGGASDDGLPQEIQEDEEQGVGSCS